MTARFARFALPFLFVAAATAGAPRPALARPHPARPARFVANKTFGLGLIIGGPTGLSGKYYLGDSTAIDFALGEYYRFHYHDALGIHADFLWHPAVLAATDPFLLPFYVGIGGRLLSHDRYRTDYNAGTHLGVRAPIGLLMDFNRVPIDIFFELALVVDFVADNDEDNVFIDGAAGVRYYF